ncbi:MAG TPA: hypothetical protein VGJ63_20790 [Micromonosporaceae bacterium]
MNAQRMTAAVALVAAAAGIGIQILAGADYPTVPPGAIILLVAAAVCVWWRQWWALLIPTAASLFLLVGGAIAPNTADNLGAGGGRLWGTVVQLVALVVALVAAAAGAPRERRAA